MAHEIKLRLSQLGLDFHEFRNGFGLGLGIQAFRLVNLARIKMMDFNTFLESVEVRSWSPGCSRCHCSSICNKIGLIFHPRFNVEYFNV